MISSKNFIGQDNKRPCRKCSFAKDSESGMTLMEVLIAIAVLGVIAAAFLTALGGGLKGAIVADERTVAESLARSQLEAIRNAKYDDEFPYEYAKIDSIPDGYDMTVAVEPFNPITGSPDGNITDFQRIIVTVIRVSDGEPKKVLEVETYKEKR